MKHAKQLKKMTFWVSCVFEAIHFTFYPKSFLAILEEDLVIEGAISYNGTFRFALKQSIECPYTKFRSNSVIDEATLYTHTEIKMWLSFVYTKYVLTSELLNLKWYLSRT